MVPEVLRYRIPDDQRAAFETAYREADDILFHSPHCLGYDLMRSEDEPGLYMLIVFWDSAEGHVEGFRKLMEFERFESLVSPFAPHLLEMRHYVHLEGRDRL